MPGLLDKVRQNSGDIAANDAMTRGNSKALMLAYESSDERASEIHQYGWDQDAEVATMLKEQEADCAELQVATEIFHKAQRKHFAGQLARNNAMRLFVDRQLAKRIP